MICRHIQSFQHYNDLLFYRLPVKIKKEWLPGCSPAVNSELVFGIILWITTEGTVFSLQGFSDCDWTPGRRAEFQERRRSFGQREMFGFQLQRNHNHPNRCTCHASGREASGSFWPQLLSSFLLQPLGGWFSEEVPRPNSI